MRNALQSAPVSAQPKKSFLARLFRRKEWRYVGTARGRTVWVDDDGPTGSESQFYWYLTERSDGKRRVVPAREYHQYEMSKGAEEVHSEVMAWLHGGPYPSCGYEPSRPKPKLLVFPGGKESPNTS